MKKPAPPTGISMHADSTKFMQTIVHHLIVCNKDVVFINLYSHFRFFTVDGHHTNKES